MGPAPPNTLVIMIVYPGSGVQQVAACDLVHAGVTNWQLHYGAML